MACPYFYPTERFVGVTLWPHPARLPLGDGFAGCCAANPSDGFSPAENTLKECCNLGYARRCCDRFPQEGADAVRFTVSSERDAIIRVWYVLERDHHPYANGALEYDREQRAFVPPPENRVLTRQAEVYVESYLRRTFRL